MQMSNATPGEGVAGAGECFSLRRVVRGPSGSDR